MRTSEPDRGPNDELCCDGIYDIAGTRRTASLSRSRNRVLRRYFIGRGWTEAARRPATVDWLAREITKFTGGNPLVLNLEGVLLEEQPSGANTVQHLMLAQLALPLLGKLRLAAVNLANNHSHDFGEEGAAETAKLMERAGIAVLRHGVVRAKLVHSSCSR